MQIVDDFSLDKGKNVRVFPKNTAWSTLKFDPRMHDDYSGGGLQIKAVVRVTVLQSSDQF